MPENHQTGAQQARLAESADSVILPVAGNSLAGACVGAIAGYAFLPPLLSYERAKEFGALLGLSLNPADISWLCAALGAAIGVIVGIIGGLLEIRRNEGVRQTVESLGAQFSPCYDPGLSDKLGLFFQTNSFLKVYNVIQTQLQGIRFAVCEVAIETGSDTDSSTTTVRQTVAHYESDTVQFPEFTLQPEGFLLKIFSGAIGIQKIIFPAHREFSKDYHLTAVHAENTRKLFNDRLIDNLSRRKGICISTKSGGVVIYRREKLCEADELPGFISEAAEIFRLLEDSARNLEQTAETAFAVTADAKALGEKMPGLMGNIVRRSMVTRADVEAFVRQPPPRTIPANILRYSDKFAPSGAMLFGVVFIIAGAVVAFVFGNEALAGGKILTGAKWQEWAAGVIFPLAFLCIGGSIAYFAGRTRTRIKRLLCNGQTCTATIEKIDSTGWRINNEQVSLMTVHFHAEGQDMRASCKIMGDAVQRAQALAAGKKLAPILYDPADPQRILFVEALLNISLEYEK